MRYTPAVVALGLLALVSASTGQTATPDVLDARAATLEAQGRAALASGGVEAATDNFEAALAIDPGNGTLLLDLGAAARADGMQGKALHYYRAVLARDPKDLMAISGEGAALAEKGAFEKARRNLAQLQNLCGDNCQATRDLAAAIAREPQPQILTAEAVKPAAQISAN